MKPVSLATAVVLATAGGLLTSVAASPASAATTCTAPVYKRQIYANTNFSGTAKQTGCDAAISENWGTGAPASGVPRDNFSVRWSVTRDFGSGGPFALSASGLDGIRVYLDGSLKISLWKNTSTAVGKTVYLTVPSGKHTLRVDYAHWTGSAKVAFTYTPRTTATVDKVRPLAPTGATWDYQPVDAGRNTAILSWAANKEMDLAGYRVYRQVAGSTAWTRIGATTTARRTFDDTPPQTGQSYRYQIRAYDKAGNESAGTAALGPVPTPDLTAPAAPVLTVTSSVDTNALSWKAPSDAVAYSVFRKKSDGTEWKEYTPEITTTNWTDSFPEYGVAYDYKVRAYDAAWNHADSAVVTGRTTIAVPQHVTVATPDHGAVISWTDPAGNDTADYTVLRSPATSAARTWTNVTCGSRRTATDASGATVRTCTDSSGDRGKPYAYVVRRKDTGGRWSSPSAETVVTRPGDEVAPPAVTGLTAQALEYGVRLQWHASTAADLAEYRIYEQPADFDTPSYVGTVDATRTYATLRMAADGEQKRYVVLAADRWGNVASYVGDPEGDGTYWDQPVAAAEVTELDLRPTAQAPENTACDLDAIALASGAVQVDPYCYGARFKEADGYQVYRWDRVKATWTRLTDAPVTTSYWTDTTAPAGTTLYYLVSFKNEDGTEAFSNVDDAVTGPAV
ncbi:fibronectin type III domain-containing protein [Streptomyces longwoodensis]|uniref:fibronectin type III domain-containing protein n=1 Tax=Streptomyces longwoodensis TaxID=68231 RepID=UPI0037966265